MNDRYNDKYDEPKYTQERYTHYMDKAEYKQWEDQATAKGLNEDDGYDLMRDERGSW